MSNLVVRPIQLGFGILADPLDVEGIPNLVFATPVVELEGFLESGMGDRSALWESDEDDKATILVLIHGGVLSGTVEINSHFAHPQRGAIESTMVTRR